MQPPLMPFVCSWKSCEREAVCGLVSKSAPEVHVNICREHFRELKRREYKDGEERQGYDEAPQ